MKNYLIALAVLASCSLHGQIAIDAIRVGESAIRNQVQKKQAKKAEAERLAAIDAEAKERARRDSIYQADQYRIRIARDSVAAEKRRQAALERTDQLRRDSIRAAAEATRRDSIDRLADKLVRQMLLNDSLAQVDLLKQYHFVNTDQLNLREKPDGKSRKLATLAKGSFVTIVGQRSANGYIRVQSSDYDGYVSANYLVSSIDLLDVPARDKDYLKKQSNYTIITEPDPPKVEQQEGTIEWGSRTRYIRGPKGGCYYINGNGNRVYVDRSLCD
jgi:hypothetical protein